MTHDEIATTLAVEMLRKSGVREWEDVSGVSEAIALTAVGMASVILSGGTNGDDEVANKVLKIDETTIVFGSEVGDDVAWSSESIANAAGRQSALHDQGVGSTARALEWMYRIYTQAQATPTIGNVLEMYLKTSDGAHPDNDDGTGDAALSAADKRRNLTFLSSPIVDEAAANIEYVSKGTVEIPERHFGVVMYNQMGSTVTADAAETKAEFTPIPMEIQ